MPDKELVANGIRQDPGTGVVAPVLHALLANPEFEHRVEKLPGLMNMLLNCQPRMRENLGDLPTQGIYVFYEGDVPLYVGRTDRMRARIQEHGRPGSDHNDASFAFLMAKSVAESRGIPTTAIRKDLSKDPGFNLVFLQQKKRVAAMGVRFVNIVDPLVQALFEVYAALYLATPWNDFSNH